MRLTILILALLSASYAQKIQITLLSKSTLMEREEHAPATASERQKKLRELFLEAGCANDSYIEQQVEQVGATNIICRLKGQTDETIIIGASYSPTVPDNWSSASLLPSLYESLAPRKRRHTLIFVAFADDQQKLTGSEFFVGHMSPTEIGHTEAMINLDALGFSPTKICTEHCSKDLVKAFFTVVYTLKRTASQVDLARGMNTDSQPFASRSIPQVTIHSLTMESVSVLQDHGSLPPMRFRPERYYDSYHVIAGYLAYLDKTLKLRTPKK